MNSLIILENLEEGCVPGERGVNIYWADAPPTVGELVGMGLTERWWVNRVSRYTSANFLIEAIYLVEVAVEPKTPDRKSTDRPYIECSAVGEAVLGMGYMVDPKSDYDRGQLHNYVQDEATGRFEKVWLPWEVEDVEVFVKNDEQAPYNTFALCWCAAIPEGDRELVAA
jgi:hypothetical protein